MKKATDNGLYRGSRELIFAQMPSPFPILLTLAALLPPRTGADSVHVSIGRMVANVDGAVMGVAFRDLGSDGSLYLNADDSFRGVEDPKSFRAGLTRDTPDEKIARSLTADLSRLVYQHASAAGGQAAS
jgi:hypothetical protein